MYPPNWTSGDDDCCGCTMGTACPSHREKRHDEEDQRDPFFGVHRNEDFNPWERGEKDPWDYCYEEPQAASSRRVHGGFNPCPKCGMMLVLKKGKFGMFWGCENFESSARCYGSRNFPTSDKRTLQQVARDFESAKTAKSRYVPPDPMDDPWFGQDEASYIPSQEEQDFMRGVNAKIKRDDREERYRTAPELRERHKKWDRFWGGNKYNALDTPLIDWCRDAKRSFGLLEDSIDPPPNPSPMDRIFIDIAEKHGIDPGDES